MTVDSDQTLKAPADEIDIASISGLIHAMNMAASKLTAYPEGHPFVVEAFRKVEETLEGILKSRDQLTFGIAKDVVLLGTETLDPKNPIFQRFARILFEQGVVGLTLLRGLTIQELMDFDVIIAQKRNDVYRQGGIEVLLEKAGITHLLVQVIDYGLFHTDGGTDSPERKGPGEGGQSSFWESFVRGLFEGTIDPGGMSDSSMTGMDADSLATMLNNNHLGQGQTVLEGLDVALSTTIKHRGFDQLASDNASMKKISDFLVSLNDELRRSFLERLFGSLADNETFAESIVAGFDERIILDALREHTAKQIYVPPNMVKVLQKLAKTAPQATPEEIDRLVNLYSKEDLVEKLKTLFREEEVETFVPPDYARILQEIVSIRDLSDPDLLEMQQLGQTLSDHSINTSLASVIVDIIVAGDAGGISEDLLRRLKECFTAIIDHGDFYTLLSFMETLDKAGTAAPEDDRPSGNLVDTLADKPFVEAILAAAAKWGKEKQFHISRVVKRFGVPFIDPLLDHLAEEGNKTLRLFYIDLFKELGDAARDRVLERLSDKRWYVVRNLLVILRQFNNPGPTPALYALLDNPHPRVQEELLHTLIVFEDPRAVEILLQEIDSSDPETSLKAIVLAGMTHDPRVSARLTGFLKKSGFDKSVVKFKAAAVQALAEIGDPSVLPVFKQILKAFSLFSRKRLQQLKMEVISSLAKYPVAEVAPILTTTARSRSGPLAREAARVLKVLKVEP